jgi:periodic tryptophan protein 2
MPSLAREYEPLVLYKNYTRWQNDKIISVNWSSDSRFILTGSKDTTVRLMNLYKIKNYIPFMFTGHKKQIVNAFFSEDNIRIFSISKDGILFVWKYVSELSDDFSKQNKFERRVKSNRNLKSIDEILKEKGIDKDDNLDYEEDELDYENKKNEKNVDKDLDLELNENENEKIITNTNKDYDLIDLNDNNNKDPEEEYFSEFEKMICNGRYILEKKQQFQINGKISIAEINTKTNIIVFGLSTGIFCIYDINTFENKYTLQISENKINSLSINKDGLWLAFGSRKLGQLVVWEWKSETYVHKQQGHSFDISAIAYSPDGSLIASGSNEGKIKLWDTNNAACVITFSEHISKVSDIKFVPNKNNVMVSCSYDGTVRAYDLIKYRNFRIMTTPTPCQLNCIAVDFSGEIICAGGMDPYSIYVWSLKSGDLIDVLKGHTAPISSIAFSQTKDLLVSGSWDKSIKLWELYAKKSQFETYLNTSEVVSLDLSPDDKEIAVATLNGDICTWDVETGSLRNIMDCRRDIWGGRSKTDKFSAANAFRNKHFNGINYNLSGNLMLAGGESQYVCLYDMHFQILIKKFCLTHNRSIDGILHKLNSKNITENFNEEDDFENSDDSDFEKKVDFMDELPGAKNKSRQKGNRNLAKIKIIAVKFSQTNRSWAVATTEGIFIYSLDSSLNFTPLQLDINITSKNAEDAFKRGETLKAITYGFYLNDYDLVTKYINSISHSQIILICNKLNFNLVGPMLDFLAKKVESEKQIQLYMLYIK